MKLEINYGEKNISLDSGNKVTEIKGDISRRALMRISYYLFKVIYSMPRLYGKLDPKDPLNSWFKSAEITFTRLLTQEMENSRLDYDFSFNISTGKVSLTGKVMGSDVAVKVTAEKQLESNDAMNPVMVDSFYMGSFPKIRPYLVPSCRVGLFSAFNRFTVLQFESPSGIPKTLGVLAEFINSVVLPPGYRDLVLNREIKVSGTELTCDDMPVYNCEPEVINKFILNFFSKNSEINSVCFLEDPELYGENRDKLISSFKGNVVFSSGDYS